MNQLAQWQAWLNRPENLMVFYDHFEIPGDIRRHLTFCPQFILIFGRRREFEHRPELIRLRSQFAREGQAVMTFDRLKPDRGCWSYICAAKTSERYRALAVPALFHNGPHVASSLKTVEGLPEAIASSEWISQQRKEFLIKRLPYWNEWASQKVCGIVLSGDWE